MKLIARSSWGARYGRGPTNITPGAGGVAVHYVGAGRLTGGAHSKCAARVRSIEAQHVNGNGWAGIAYNFLTCHHGYVFEGRGLGHRSAAQGTTSGNQNYYAVCALIGAGDTPNDTLKASLRDAIDHMRGHGAGARVRGHRDFHATSCPGSALHAWVKAGAHRPGGTTPAPAPPPAGTAPPWPGTYLRYPPLIKTAAARTWQTRMKERGWRIDVDGFYGAESKATCEAFQAEKDLEVDGVVGPETWRMSWTAPIT